MKSLQNEGICGSTEQSEVLLDVLSVKQTVQLASKADRLGFRSKWYFVHVIKKNEIWKYFFFSKGIKRNHKNREGIQYRMKETYFTIR